MYAIYIYICTKAMKVASFLKSQNGYVLSKGLNLAQTRKIVGPRFAASSEKRPRFGCV